MKDRVFNELRSIVLLLWGHVAESATIMKDSLSLGFEEEITTTEDGLQNS